MRSISSSADALPGGSKSLLPKAKELIIDLLALAYPNLLNSSKYSGHSKKSLNVA